MATMGVKGLSKFVEQQLKLRDTVARL